MWRKPTKTMKRLRIHAAAVCYSANPDKLGGLSLANYTGPIDGETLVSLRTSVVADSPTARTFLIQFHQACLLMGVDPFIPEGRDYSRMSDGVIVCRRDQLDVMQAYARYMAARGVIRAVFLDSERHHAQAFAQRILERSGR
jgi:hypothetical protein